MSRAYRHRCSCSRGGGISGQSAAHSFATARMVIADIRVSLYDIGASNPTASPHKKVAASSFLLLAVSTDPDTAIPHSAQFTTQATAHHEMGLMTSNVHSFAAKAIALWLSGMTNSSQDNQNAHHKPKQTPVTGR